MLHNGVLGRKSTGSNLLEQFATFPASFSKDFACGKLTGMVATGDHDNMACHIVIIVNHVS